MKQGCEGERLVNHQQGGSTMCKAFRKQEGFTLIELMIVVAIIGILAAIAIPNFLTYQLKSRQSEAKTNLQAIKTSEVSFQAERGCYIGVTVETGQPLAAAGTKIAPWPWGVGAGPTAPGTLWCTAVYTGFFADIGFKATGNVMYVYGVDGKTVAAPGIYTTAVSCPLAIAGTGAAGAAGNNNFVAMAQTNLDGDAAVSTWDATVDHGSNDCTTGVY
jgi:type IV pilus assembly protein PilA